MEIRNDKNEPHTTHDLIVDLRQGSTGDSGRGDEPLQQKLTHNPGKHEPDRSPS